MTFMICSQIHQGKYPGQFVNAMYFRLVFWDKAGINAYQAGFVPPGMAGVFHKPNICLCNRKSRQLAYSLRHDKDYAFDQHGLREVEDLILNHGFTIPLHITRYALVGMNDRMDLDAPFFFPLFGFLPTPLKMALENRVMVVESMILNYYCPINSKDVSPTS